MIDPLVPDSDYIRGRIERADSLHLIDDQKFADSDKLAPGFWTASSNGWMAGKPGDNFLLWCL